MSSKKQTAWPIKALSKVAKVERNSVRPEHIESGTQYVGLENITSSGEFDAVRSVTKGELASNKFAFDAGHILFGKLRPYLSKIARPDFSGICSTDIIPIRVGDEIDRCFLHYFLRQPRMIEYATVRSKGANLPRLSPSQLAQFPVPVPPLAEQKRIADILDKADAVRREAGNYKTLTDNFLQSKFSLLFGDPKRNPQGWKEVELQSIAKLKSGVTKGRKLIGKTTVDVPYMRVWNVQDAHIRMDDIKTIEVLKSDIEKYRLEEGDLLLTEGGDPDQLGRGAIWYSPIPVCIHQNHIFRVRANRDLVTPEFLSAMVGSEYCKQYFLRMAKQTTGIASINMTQLKRCPVMLPPLDLQRKFSEFDFKLKNTIQNLERRRVVGDELFNSIAQKAFKGEL